MTGPQDPRSGSQYLTTAEMARDLQISERAARRLIKSGAVPALNVSNGAKRARWRVAAADINALKVNL